jgi:phenylalanyl-tRNA synthetase beta chain
MRVTVEWLEEFFASKMEAEWLASKLTMAGLEVEAIEESAIGPVLEIGITPNRGDCLSVIGLAHEISAITGRRLRQIKSPKPTRSSGEASVQIKAPKLCTRYCGQLMENVSIGPAPEWMRKRLEACGIRSINNVVDVTNYVMLETGQPLHAFDLDRLEGGGIQVRRARPKENLVTLDGKERQLNNDDLVIADKSGPVALAGVMGGLNSEIHDGTKRLFLESACFDPGCVRRTSKRLGLQSESSYRFERGIDWFRIRFAIEHMALLLQEVAGASPIGKVTDVFLKQPTQTRIMLDPDKVSGLLGGRWSLRDIEMPLKRLGCNIKKNSVKKWQVKVPERRHDLNESVDLIEEVARLQGYDRVEAEVPSRPVQVASAPRTSMLETLVKQHLVHLGFSELIHFSFCNANQLDDKWVSMAPELANPLSQETGHLRPTLLISLLDAVRYHQSRQMMNLRLFELRSVFRKRGSSIEERKMLSGLLSGEGQPSHWSRKQTTSDFYEAKGVIEGILSVFGSHEFAWNEVAEDSPYAGFFLPSRSAELVDSERTIGVIGELHPEKESAWNLKGPIFVFELDWESLLSIEHLTPRYKAISNVPWVERDLAVVVDESVRAEEVINIVKEVNEEMIRNILIFDVYRGGQVPSGKKSLAFTFQIGHSDRTLTDNEVNVLQEKIVKSLKNQLQVTIR